jgi:hypothetical protein
MSTKRKPIGARQDNQGRISHVLFEGNTNFTPLDTAINMAKKEQVDLVVVNKGGKEHVRTRPDSQEKNNLDSMAGD